MGVMFEDEGKVLCLESVRVDGTDEDLVEGYALNREPIRDRLAGEGPVGCDLRQHLPIALANKHDLALAQEEVNPRPD